MNSWTRFVPFCSALVLLAGCESKPAATTKLPEPINPIVEVGTTGELTNVNLPMPGADGGPMLPELPALGENGQPQLPALPPLPGQDGGPELPQLPELPEAPGLEGQLEPPPLPQLPQQPSDLS